MEAGAGAGAGAGGNGGDCTNWTGGEGACGTGRGAWEPMVVGVAMLEAEDRFDWLLPYCT